MGRDEAPDDNAAGGPDGGIDDMAADMDIVAATYRSISDAAAFDTMVMAWERKISESAQEGVPSLYLDRRLTRHLGAAKALIDRFDRTQPDSPAEVAVTSVAAPAVVLNPACVVVAANALAKNRFASRQGQVDTLEWLHPASAEDFAAVRRSAQDGANRRHAIVRTANDGAETGIAEVYVIDGSSGDERNIAVRALEIVWTPEVDAQLTEAFGLTDAEREVAQLLFETRNSAQIAERRETSTQTVRTQIKKILAKTETASQVDLIRMLALLSARASHGLTSDADSWHDPWNNERVITRPDGRQLAYSWTGARNGRPVLVVHGLTLGYALGPIIENGLAEANIKLIALSRPGCGNSGPSSSDDILDDHADAIYCLLHALGLSKVPCIGLSSGALPLMKTAANHPELISRILTSGMWHPLDREHQSRLATGQRTLFRLARSAPAVAELIVAAAQRLTRQKGLDWYLHFAWDHQYGGRAANSMDSTQIAPLIRNAARLTQTYSARELVREIRMASIDFQKLMPGVMCPAHHLQGTEDRTYTPRVISKLNALNARSTTEGVPDAGYFLPYERPELLLEHIKTLAFG